ncbi:unnamed protein product, partial [Symbiodinium necroappetens]
AGQQLGGALRGPRCQPFRIFEDDVPVGRGRGEPEQSAGGADEGAHEVAETVFSGGVFLWRPFQVRFAQGSRIGRHRGAPQKGCLRGLRGFAVPRPVETVAAVAAGMGR